MGALANFIERAGVATASISLIREQSEAVRPPRALWVPFALGRPLGSADDLRTFHHEAIAAQPGPGAPNHAVFNDWIFGGTALGDALQAVARHLTEDNSPMSLLVRGLLIPEGYFLSGSAFPDSPEFGQGRRSPRDTN